MPRNLNIYLKIKRVLLTHVKNQCVFLIEFTHRIGDSRAQIRAHAEQLNDWGRAMEIGYVEKERFEFLERLLTWRGRIKRADLRQQFGLSESGANQVFRAYKTLRPHAMELDRNIKAYVPTACFEPAFYTPAIVHSELQVIGSGLSISVEQAVLLALAKSIRESRIMQIEYVSLGQEKTKREIYPLALIRMIDGFPPALHAWCYLRKAPRTFQLSNIAKVKVGKKIQSPPISTEMATGAINFDGICMQIPRSAIYAVAGQCFGVPEFRNAAALESVKELANKLSEHWTAGTN
ncbi:hypothetical protein CSQ96_07025 [Janthinobacterium sp. BJB412]|nr:hypothetical protein CSQ96_07025 [Janthinobacterium sp. BJB412]